MADKYRDPLLFFYFPQLDSSLFTRFLSQTLPHPMSKKPKNKPRPPENPNHNRRTPTPPPPLPAEAPAEASPAPPAAPAPAAAAPRPEAPANSPAPQPSPITESAPKLGNRKSKSSDEGEKAVDVPHSGLQVPGAPLQSEDEKSSLKIKIHLNIHAKVRLDLDAQVYGDVVIGLL